jgi:hypothetical protein
MGEPTFTYVIVVAGDGGAIGTRHAANFTEAKLWGSRWLPMHCSLHSP